MHLTPYLFQSTLGASGNTEFDSFLLDFDIAGGPPKGSDSASSPGGGGFAALVEKIESGGKGRGDGAVSAAGRGKTHKETLTEMLKRIPDLSFMKSKTLAMPASKYKMDLA